MGLFFDYTKPGPGVDKNAPKKKGIFRYFEIFTRKFSNLIKLNMLYFIVSIPMLVIIYLLTTPYCISLFTKASQGLDIPLETINIYSNIISFFITFMFIIVFGSGPASASLAYVTRCFIREEHVWLISDFFTKFKENFKQGIIVSLIDIVFYFFATFSISFYYNQYILSNNDTFFVLSILVLIFSLIFALMHYYVYQLMITFENRLIDLFKNSIILTLSSLPVLVLLTILTALVAFFVFNTFTPIYALIITFVLLITFLRFPFEFYCARTIQNKILNNIEKTSDTAEDNGSEI